MKLILTAPVEKLGVPGDIVEVKDGYGRNFLLPRNVAIRWTRGAEAQIEGIKRAREAKQVRSLEHAKEIREQLESLKVEVPARAQGDKLFGSVTVADIAQAIKKSGGPSIDKRAITITKPIRTLGNHTVAILLHEAVTAHLPVTIVAQ